MLTYKLKISNTIDISDICKNYSYMFRKLFANFELSQDKPFQKELINKYGFDSWFYESCRMDVETKLSQIETFNKNNRQSLARLQNQLSLNKFVGNKSKREKYYIIKKINSLTKAVDRRITFGTRAVLQKISFLSNPILNETNDQRQTRLLVLKKAKEKYQKSRLLPVSIVGEAPQGSNRKFDFDLSNNKVVFKPKNGIKIPIEFYCSKKQKTVLNKLQDFIGQQPISIRLNNEYLWLMFDEEKLSGMNFDKYEYFKELKTIPKNNKEARKDCYKKHIALQEQRMLKDKIKDRCISFDLNPEFIGISVLEGTDDNFKLVYKEVVSFENLNTKKGLSSTDEKQIYQNNKRVHELRETWKYIFDLAIHYKVSKCIIEQLEFKQDINDSNTEFNRKTKNLWHRENTVELITKYCHVIGIKLIDVNACYSSFIGNIKNNYYDPLNAAIEIGRRGITKYLKGGFYPKIERKDIDTMNQLGLDVRYNTVSSWVEAYRMFKTAGLRYRRGLKNFSEHYLSSRKSYVKLYNFYTL